MADPTLIIDAEPDWSNGLELSYGFQTVVSTSPRFVEQRRPLFPYPIRSLSCSFVLEGEYGQELINKLTYGKALLLCVPIFTEPIFATAITAGLSSITVTEDLSYCWNIQNCDYAVVINFVTGSRQMLKVSSASGVTIPLSEAIETTFDADESVIYPAFAGIIKSFKKTDITDLIASIDCEFEETKMQAEEYEGTVITWDDPQTCQDDIFDPPSPTILAGDNNPNGQNGYFLLDNWHQFNSFQIVAAGQVTHGYAYIKNLTNGDLKMFVYWLGSCYYSESVRLDSALNEWIEFEFMDGPIFTQENVDDLETLSFGIMSKLDSPGAFYIGRTDGTNGWRADETPGGYDSPSGCVSITQTGNLSLAMYLYGV